MGAFDGVEVCKAVGLCKGDGLAIFKKFSGSKAEKIQKIYKNYLKIAT